MQRFIYFTCAAVVLVLGLGTVIYYGLQPQSIPKIDWSQTTTPEQLGAAVAKDLRMEIRASPLLLVGLWPEHPEELQAAKAFFSQIQEPGLQYDVILTESELPGAKEMGGQPIAFKDDLAAFAAAAKQSLAENHRVAVITVSMYSSQLLHDGPASRLKNEFGLAPMSITFSPFPLARADESSVDATCSTGGQDEGLGALGCMVVQKARSLYRKKHDPKKFSGVMDQVGGRDYLMLLAPPPKAAP